VLCREFLPLIGLFKGETICTKDDVYYFQFSKHPIISPNVGKHA